jgi:hypothetical protein
MAQQTSVDWLVEKWAIQGTLHSSDLEQAKQMEKEQIIEAIMYALDEDGHTGDWKIKFANDYYKKINEGYDIRNKTTTRFFGDAPL